LTVKHLVRLCVIGDLVRALDSPMLNDTV